MVCDEMTSNKKLSKEMKRYKKKKISMQLTFLIPIVAWIHLKEHCSILGK